MKSTIAKLILLLLPLSAIAQHGERGERGGSVAGGGADTHSDAAAWFTDPKLNKIVQACIVTDVNFGVSSTKIKELTQTTFQKWANYYQNTGLASSTDNSSQWQGCSIDGGQDDRKGFKIATKLAVHDLCDGSEDLTLYFGVINDDLQMRKNHYVFPYAFSEIQENYRPGTHQAAWSKGMIWIAPGFSWSNNEAAPLEMTLLHEFGHVFGTGHIENTIMSENIGTQILAMTRKANPKSIRAQVNPLYLSIDKTAYLVFRPEGDYEVPLAPPIKGFDRNEQMQRNIMQNSYSALTGMMLQDDSFEAEFTKPAGVPLENSMRNIWQLGLFASSLTVRADGIESKLKFVPTSFVSAQTESGIAFNEGCLKQPHVSGSIAGHLLRPNGTTKQVVLSINTQGRVQILDDPYNPSSFCEAYSHMGVPCELLKTDYDKIAEQLRAQN